MFSLFIRVTRKGVCPCRSAFKYYSQKYVDLPSALYVPLEYRSTVFSALEPHFDIDYKFKNLTKLKSDLEKRNIKVDVDALYQYSVLYKRLNEVIKSTSEEIEVLKRELNQAQKKTENDPTLKQTKESLELKFSEAKKKLLDAKQEFIPLEKKFLIPFLQLPNSLHKHTTRDSEVLFSYFPKPSFSFKPKSHVQIGLERDELYFKDVSPASYYMKGNLAVLELALSDFILSRFRKHGFKNYVNMDISRAVLLEGCGVNLKDKDNVIGIIDPHCLAFNQSEYLVGGSSLSSFVSLFCKGLVTFSKDSPIRLVSIGRKYDAANASIRDEKSLFNCIQSTCVSAFVAYPHEVVEEAIFNEIAMLITQIYTELEIHFKLIQYGASDLKPHESLAVGVCFYSPFNEKYIEIGRISLCQDFISKRLQIVEILEKKRGTFMRMIHVQIVDVRNWIGCLVENTQTEDENYVVPKCLQSFMYE